MPILIPEAMQQKCKTIIYSSFHAPPVLHNSTCSPRERNWKKKTNAHEQIGVEGFICLTHAMYPHGWAELSSISWPILPSITTYGLKQYLAQQNKQAEFHDTNHYPVKATAKTDGQLSPLTQASCRRHQVVSTVKQ